MYNNGNLQYSSAVILFSSVNVFNGSVNSKPAQMLGRRSFRAREKFFLLHVTNLTWSQDTFLNPEVGRGFRWREITLQHTVLHFQPHILKLRMAERRFGYSSSYLAPRSIPRSRVQISAMFPPG